MNKNKKSSKVVIPAKKLERVIGVDLDKEIKQIRLYTNDILINQIDRDARKNAKSFDKLCHKDVESISVIVSRCLMHQNRKIISAVRENDEVMVGIMNLIWNTCTSFSAAVLLLRSGFRLQPGIISRNIVETVSLALYLFSNQDEFENYRAGKIKSSKTISFVKQMIPPYGELYGFYSAEFAHIGGLQQKAQPVAEYFPEDESLIANIHFLKTLSWVLDVASELLCYDFVDEKRYWSFLGKNSDGNLEYSYTPAEETQKWLTEYLEG